MGKALVIKNADFYDNRIGSVTWGDKPCTGITISQSTATVTDTLTLTATPTPGDTTDAVIWSSSNSRIATVINGVVTAISAGTCTITVTCGSYSASCDITVAPAIKTAKGWLSQVATRSSGTVLVDCANCGSANNYVSYGSANGVYPIDQRHDTGDIADIYPIIIPEGATSISVSTTSDYAALIVYYDKDQVSSHSTTWVRDSALVLDGETVSGGTDWSISSWEYGNKTFTIPATSGIDSFTLTFSAKNATAFNAWTDDVVSISFGYV